MINDKRQTWHIYKGQSRMITQWKHFKCKAKPAFHSRRLACLLTLLIFLICGCSAGFVKDMKTNIEDIKISSRMQKKQHHELIRTLQPMLDRKEPLSSFRLFLLASAYYEIRDYEKMFRTVGLLELQINKGDVAGYGGNLTVYPQILRGYAYLD